MSTVTNRPLLRPVTVISVVGLQAGLSLLPRDTRKTPSATNTQTGSTNTALEPRRRAFLPVNKEGE